MTKKQHLPKSTPKPVAEFADTPFWKRYKYVFLAGIVALTALIYIPSSLNNNFTRYWDDESIVVQNEDIRELSWEHLENMFTKSYYDMYCPVKILSHTLDYQLFELNPAGYHLMSLLYHLINIVLVFFLISMMLKSSPAALVAALIYAVHPMAVETVSWVTGRGDLLYALFAFPALMCYVNYVTKGQKFKYIALTFLFFILSGLAKPTAMTLPITLFVFDWYYRRKLFSKKVLLEKIPFFAISIILGILSIKLRGSGAPDLSGFLEFFKSYKGYLFITYPLSFYILKFLFPLPLSFIYPHVSYYFYNKLMLPVLVWSSPFILLAALIIIFKAKNFRRQLIFAGLFYFTTIFSTLQIIPVVAVSAHDRYFYVPIFGFLFFTAWLYVYFKQRNRIKALKIYFIALLVVAVSFVYISYNRTKIWQSTITLFEDVIKKQPRFIEGYDKLSEHYEIGRDYRNALKWAKITLTKRNNNPGTYLRMVRCHLALNEPDSAMIYAPYAVRSVANLQQLMEASSMKGYLDMRAGKYADAVVDYDQILHYNPNSAPDLLQRAQAKAAMQQYALALADIEQALQVNPEYPDAYFIRGKLRFMLEQRAAACADFNKAHSLGQQDAAEWLQLYCR